MSISVACANCGNSYRLKEDLAGKRLKCPGCGSAIVVPSQPNAPHPEPQPRSIPATPTIQQAIEQPASSVSASLGIRSNSVESATAAVATVPRLVWGVFGGAAMILLGSSLLLFIAYRHASNKWIAAANQLANPPAAVAPVHAPSPVAPPAPVPPVQPSAAPIVQPSAVPAVAPAAPAPAEPVPSPAPAPTVAVAPPPIVPPTIPAVVPPAVPVAPEPVAPVLTPPPTVEAPQPVAVVAPPPGPAVTEIDQWQPAVDPPAEKIELAKVLYAPIRIDANRSTKFQIPLDPSPFVVSINAKFGDTQADLWDLRSGKRVGHAASASQNVALGHAVSSDGTLLATHGTQGIEVYSLRKDQPPTEIPAEVTKSTGLRFYGTNQLVGFNTLGQPMTFWDAKSGRILREVKKPGGFESQPHAISPGRKYLACSDQNNLYVTDINAGAKPLANKLLLPSSVLESRARCVSLAFSPDGAELAGLFQTFSNDQSLICWDLAQGTVAVEHRLSKSYLGGKPQTTLQSQAPPLSWLGTKGGWLLFGLAVIDRARGGPAWRIPDPKIGSLLVLGSLGEDRVLTVRAIGDETTLESLKLSRADIETGLKALAAGSAPGDVGAPQATKEDWSGVVQVSTAPMTVTWDVKPERIAPPLADKYSVPIPLSTFFPHVEQVFISRTAAAAAVLYRSLGDKAPDGSPAKQRLVRFNVKTGKKVGEFQLPHDYEMLSVHPDGTRALLRWKNDKKRVDDVNIVSGKSLSAWRPFQNETHDFQRGVKWATHIGPDHVLVLGDCNKFVLFKLPECRAVYVLSGLYSADEIALSPDRTYLAFGRETVVRLIEATTGKVCGDLEGSVHATLGGGLVFDPTGERLAQCATVFDHSVGTPTVALGPAATKNVKRSGNMSIRIWNLQTGESETDFVIPHNSSDVTWCGTKHLLVDKTYLVDIDRRMVIWKYSVNFGSVVNHTTDGRTWYVSANALVEPAALVSTVLPERQVQTRAAQAKTPEPLFATGMSVAVAVQMKNVPAEREQLRDSFTTLLNKKLVRFGFSTDANAKTRLLVNLQERRTTEVLNLKLLGFAASAGGGLAIPVTELVCDVAIVGDKNQPIWTTSQIVKTGATPRDRSTTPGNDLKEYFAEQQWRAMYAWMDKFELPKIVLPVQAGAGLGESILTVKGPEVITAASKDR